MSSSSFVSGLSLASTRVIKRIHILRDRKADTPEVANSRLKAIRQVRKWANEPDVAHLTSTPAGDVAYIKTGSTGFHTWTRL